MASFSPLTSFLLLSYVLQQTANVADNVLVGAQDIAASYLVGALGGIVYLRLLGRGVDSVAASSFGEAAGGALGQQRLLIPVILVLFFNRYGFYLGLDLSHCAAALIRAHCPTHAVACRPPAS